MCLLTTGVTHQDTAAWAIVHGLATLTLDARLPPEPDHARQVLDLFVDGLVERRRSR
jgi:hypothetical protein